MQNGSSLHSRASAPECREDPFCIPGRSPWNAGRIHSAFQGERPGDVAGDLTLLLYPLPKIALLYIFYFADEDFPASATCLFSSNALSFMPLDGLADVAEYTSKEIIHLLNQKE